MTQSECAVQSHCTVPLLQVPPTTSGGRQLEEEEEEAGAGLGQSVLELRVRQTREATLPGRPRRVQSTSQSQSQSQSETKSVGQTNQPGKFARLPVSKKKCIFVF